MKHFKFDLLFTLLALATAAYWGFERGGISALFSAVFICFVLALMEISLSFDNAVVNASILKHWDKFWQTIFLTVGMLIAVFGMRLLFPIIIVAITANMDAGAVVHLALNHPDAYAAKLMAHHTEIAAFGGMFLLLVFLNFVFDDKQVHWFDWLERKLARLGKVDAMSVFVAMMTLTLSLSWVDSDKEAAVLMAGFFGILVHLGVNVLSSLLGGRGTHNPNVTQIDGTPLTAIAKGGMVGFLYLEVLDASFSFDGVIGAFAITNDVVIIMLGLAIGAMFVRSMTIFLVEKGTLDAFIYLEHGAHYAIGALAVIMLLSMKFHIPEVITGFIGAAFIVAAVIASLKYRTEHAPSDIQKVLVQDDED